MESGWFPCAKRLQLVLKERRSLYFTEVNTQAQAQRLPPRHHWLGGVTNTL